MYNTNGYSAKTLVNACSPEQLLDEYKLIEAKKSQLSKYERDLVIQKLKELIDKGVIQQND